MITSTSNDLIKSIRKLRNKKIRENTGLAFIEGTKLVIDAIERSVVMEKVVISESFTDSQKRTEILTRLNDLQIERVNVSDGVFQSLSGKENPQGIGAVVKQVWHPFEKLVDNFSGTWVGLWEVADPGNLGSIMRTVDAVGAEGIILIGNCTDPYEPGAIRGSMGAIFSNSLVKSDLIQFINWIKSGGITAIGTADSALCYYREVRYPVDMVLVMGSERQGLPVEIIEACQNVVRIPMTGISDSLNLSVATGVVLYEMFDQNRREGSI